MPFAHDDRLEQRSRQLVALPGVGIRPGGPGVQQVSLEPLEHVRAAVGGGLGEPRELQLEPRPPRLVLALGQTPSK